MEDLKAVIRLIKIVVENRHNHIENNLKLKDYSVLEGIIILDKAISILRDDFRLSNNEIWRLLKEYKIDYKEKESD